MTDAIDAYAADLAPEDQAICAALRSAIDAALPDAHSKIWHAHPVWFIEGNPIVGYSRLKSSVRLLFWSGRSFEEPDLAPEGKFQGAEARYTCVEQVDRVALDRWLDKARRIQWDYKNIVKRKGELIRLS